MKLIVRWESDCYKKRNLNYRQELVCKALSFVVWPSAILFRVPAVLCYRKFVPSPLISILHSLDVLMELLALLVPKFPENLSRWL